MVFELISTLRNERKWIESNSTVGQQIAEAAIAFEQLRTGNHAAKSVTVVLSGGTLVITLHDALSPAEKALAQSPAGAAQVQEFHGNCSTIPPTRYGRRSKESGDESTRGRRRKSSRQAGDRSAGVHDGNRGTGVLARRQCSHGELERK